MIYHALSQELAFNGQTVSIVADAHKNDIPEDLMIVQRDCPARLGVLAKQMLSKDPVMRPTFRQVLNELISIEIEFLSDSTLIRL